MTDTSKFGMGWRRWAGAALTLALTVPIAHVGHAREVVQPLPSPESLRLNAALATLARDPRNVDALIEAGEAASAMGDPEAALGFFRRADQISGGNAQIKAGMASAMVLDGNPVAALPMFEAAIDAGAKPEAVAADRGLAYDLVGDTARAQAQYALAMKGGMDDDLRLRMAVSQAIGGNAKGSEDTLMPLLRKQDKPAWRTRAFTLAILGDTKEAVKISGTILPSELAESVAPYLRYMPRLTPSQQAAAAILGRFPRASEIGREDAKIAAYQRSTPARTTVAAADAGLVPQGEALGMSDTRARNAGKVTRVAKAERVAPPDPKPAIERSSGELPPVDEMPATTVRQAAAPPVTGATPAAQRVVETTPAPAETRATVAAATSSAAPQSAPATERRVAMAPATGTAAPGFDLARMPSTSAAGSSQPAARDIPSPANILDTAEGRALPPNSTLSTSTSPPATAAASATPAASQLATTVASTPRTSTGSADSSPAVATQAPVERVSLAEVFADLGRPSTQAAPISGAVDMRKIEPARPAPEPDPTELAAAKAAAEKKAAEARKPAPPSHPSRIWVQLGVGRDTKAIDYDWRKWTRTSAALFKGRQAHITEMGRTNRILAGPFESQKAARTFLDDAEKEGFEGAFVWTSPAGQVVDALGKN